MASIYLPEQINNNQCVVVQSDGHLRIYDRRPNGQQQSGVTYRDYYIRENYLMSSGSTDFGYYTSLNCLDNTQFTQDPYYRPDIWQSLICMVIIGLIGLYLPFKIISRMFGRWLKL